MKLRDIKLAQAFEPDERSTENTLYNGVAIGSAAGIPVSDARQALFGIEIGDVSASLTSIAYSVYASPLASGVTTDDLTAITGATFTAVPADADSIVAGAIAIKNIAVATGDESSPVYLYVKRVQTGAYAANDSVIVILNDHVNDPVDPVGTSDLEFDV